MPDPYDTCARCGSWHYTHATGTTAKFAGCKQFVPKSVEGCRTRTPKGPCGLPVVPELVVCSEHATKDALMLLIKQQQRTIRHLQECLNRGGTP